MCVCVLWSAEFDSPEGKHAALSSSEDLWKERYLVCPSITPRHLSSWVSMTTLEEADEKAAEEEKRAHMHTSSQVIITITDYYKAIISVFCRCLKSL